MATPGRTQKQIAERYKGNLGYYKERHPWRIARWWASLLAISGGIAGIIAFHDRGNEEFFSSGKISSNHAAFAQDCAKCHDKGAALGEGISLAKFRNVVKDRFRRGIDFASIDRKCEQCHKQHTLHEPNVVENRSCSVCHQEHLGPGRMAQVANLHCASCHNNSGDHGSVREKGRAASARDFSPPTASGPAGGLSKCLGRPGIHAGFFLLRGGSSGISARARESARSRRNPFQSPTPFRRGHSAGGKGPEARLQLLPQARIPRVVFINGSVSRRIARPAMRCSSTKTIRNSTSPMAMWVWCGLSCAPCRRNTEITRG